ncbi:hypothetical protein C8R44DRAFT_804135, partial [Mycena epipterygia]
IGIANLRRLLALAHLGITMCNVIGVQRIEPASQPLELSSFSFQHHATFRDEIDHWFYLLYPEHLRELFLMCNTRLLNKAVATLPPFPHVRKLTANIALSTTTLSKFLGVEMAGPSQTSTPMWGHLVFCRCSENRVIHSCHFSGHFSTIFCSSIAPSSTTSGLQAPTSTAESSETTPSPASFTGSASTGSSCSTFYTVTTTVTAYQYPSSSAV